MNQAQAREILIDHSRSKKNGSFPESVSFSSKLTNPICGDHVELRINTEENKILEIGFKAEACAICSASSSLLSQELKGASIESALRLSSEFEGGLLSSSESIWPPALENLNCFEHLRVNPARKACALLPWIALRSALKPKPESVQ